MPRRHPSDPPPPPHHVPPARRSASELGRLVRTDDIAALLAPWVPDAEDRAFVARCILSEGPMHHRVTNAALLRLLAMAVDAAGGPPSASELEGAPVPFRIPPHLDRHGDEEARYPIRLPRRAIARLAPEGSSEAAAYTEALTDGPAHHALANVVMVCMLDALLDRLRGEDRK